LAAANPAGGHYNRRKTVCENLKLASALLSRFDLVFILLDRPDEGHDRMISHHIMKTHEIATGQSRADRKANSSDGTSAINYDESEFGGTLSQRLRREVRKFEDNTVNPEILRKYVEYAKKYVHPVLTPPAAKVLYL
jgi:DNA helicase MCM8